MSDDNTVDAHDPRARHWALMIASATEAYNKSFRPTKEEWAKVQELVDSIKIAPGGALEDSMRYKFEQDGCSPEEAARLAETAANPPTRSIWP